KEEQAPRAEPVKDQAKDKEQPKKENKPVPSREEIKAERNAAREGARNIKEEESRSRTFRPRRRALEEDELAKIAADTNSEPERELPRRESIREIEEGNSAETVAHTKRKPTISNKDYDRIIENEGVLEIMRSEEHTSELQ